MKIPRSPSILSSRSKPIQLCDCPKAMFLKVPSQDSKTFPSAQLPFWQEGWQGWPCLRNILSAPQTAPCKEQPRPPFWDARASPSAVDAGDAPGGWGSPASFWKPCRYGDCVQLYGLFVVHLFQSKTFLELLGFWGFRLLVGGFEFKREMIHCEEKLSETFMVHCNIHLFY